MNYLPNNSLAIVATTIALIFLFHKKIRSSKTWHATVTPLASIIGSGFLVSAPLLILATGQWALLVMAAIVMLAYAIGASIRFNIFYVEPLLNKPFEIPWIERIELLSRPILSIAYIISVAFYLKLLSAFVLYGIGLTNPWYENGLTSLLLLFIGLVGKFRGLSMLELLETYSVNTKLAIIFAVIATHFLYNSELIAKGQWILKAYPHESWWMGFRKVLGLLIIVQGFETSRYLGYAYNATLRIQTMRYAQWISGSIYLLFVAVAMIVFNNIHQINETSIISLCRIVAPVLPFLLIIAASMSQFSAAVADSIGSAGLLAEATHRKISVNNSYLLISLVALSLTWLTNIYEIITVASKAFAIYYALQICLTLLILKRNKAHLIKITVYMALLALMIVVIIFGIPVE